MSWCIYTTGAHYRSRFCCELENVDFFIKIFPLQNRHNFENDNIKLPLKRIKRLESC